MRCTKSECPCELNPETSTEKLDYAAWVIGAIIFGVGLGLYFLIVAADTIKTWLAR